MALHQCPFKTASMRSFLVSLLLILPFHTFCAGSGDNGILKGTVSTADGQPAAYVSVLLKNTALGTVTDEKGNFEIKKIHPGNYVLLFSFLGYSDSAIAVDVRQNETSFLKVQLRRTDSELKAIVVDAKLQSKYVETKPSGSLRLNLPLIEIPQNISVVTQQTYSDQGLVSLTEGIRNVSGVSKSYGVLNDVVLIIRGTDAGGNVFRNGLGGYWWNQQEDAAMLEKVEFIKGPAGFMMSLAEPGGIVNTVTKQPSKETIANINAAYGSFNLLRLTADFGGSFSKTSRFSYRMNAGIHSQERAFHNSKALRYFLCGALKYEPGKNTSVTVEYNYMRGNTYGNNFDIPSLHGKIFALPADFAVADKNTDSLTAIDSYGRIQVNHNFNDNWHLNFQVAYVRGKEGGYLLNTDPDIPVSNDTLYRVSNFSDWRNGATVVQGFIDGKFYTGRKIEHKILLGVDYNRFHVSAGMGGTWGEQKFGLYIPDPEYDISRDSLRNFEIYPPGTAVQKWISLYIEDHIKIAGKLVMTLGTHLTHANRHSSDFFLVPSYQANKNYNFIIPRAGLTWLFSDDLSVYGLYDGSFFPQNAPNFHQQPFEPLTGHNIEAGLKSYFLSKRMSLSVSVFDIVKNNTLSADPAHDGYYIQTGQVTSKGVDIDMSGNITPAITANVNYEYANAKITKDSDPKNVGLKNLGTPDHVLNLWTKYKQQRGYLKGFSLSMGYQYMGKRSAVWNWSPGDAIHYLPAYNLLDAAIGYSNERFNIGLNVYNITNINYAVYGYFNSATSEWRYTPGEPINFRLSVGINLTQLKKNKSR